ncbi:MAG: FtsH protease activity modulator HflK [Alphaproteobacteria bacterium]|nr:FtsH protease activity modulator HflK [Alphaproteobacteria bacterium]
MSWQPPGGGGGGPWGGGGIRPPDFEDVLRRAQERVRQLLPGMGRGKGVIVVIAAVILVWLASGFYVVDPDELGVVLRFGAYNRTATPGLNYHLPGPFEKVLIPKVTRVNRIEIGYRSEGTQREVAAESLMLTGDENIVDINFTVFWLIKDAKDYLFNIRNPDGTVKVAAESAMREVIGHTLIASALAEGRAKIETDTQTLLQQILDSYHSGIEITQVQLQKVDPPAPVIDAFRDVQSAKIDQQRYINEAQTYANNLVPVAQGDASRIVQQAQAYKAQIVLQAQGDAARFLSVYNAYKVAPDVTARRLYIETLEGILKDTNKVVIDKSTSASGVVPYLPLPNLAAPHAAAPAKAVP